jgi:DNA-binding transcriptional MerR regulator
MILEKKKMTNMIMDLPDKLTFKRTEVIKLTRIDGKVLDYWQKEFGVFVPLINKLGDQFYTRRDVEAILKIRKWLIVEKISKEKIKEKLKEEKEDLGGYELRVNDNGGFAEKGQNVPQEKIKIIKHYLQEILTILDKNDKR